MVKSVHVIKSTEKKLEWESHIDMVDLNFNDYVYVKLTPEWAKMREEYERKNYKSLWLDPTNFTLERDSKGRVKLQLHDLMKLYWLDKSAGPVIENMNFSMETDLSNTLAEQQDDTANKITDAIK